MKSQEHQPKRNGRSLKLRLIASAIVLLMLALGFNAMLSLNSLEKLYVASIASQYNAIGKDLQRNIEKSLKFGKNLDKFIGMDKVLEDTKLHISRSMNSESRTEHFFTSVTADISVSIALPDGKIIYSTNMDLVNTMLPEQARPNYTQEQAGIVESYFKYQATYIIPIPIRDMKKTWLGSAIVTFDEAQIKALLTSVRNQSIRVILEISGGSALLLIVVLNVMPLRKSSTGELARLRVSVVMFLFVGGSQLLFTALNANAFKNYYVDINKEKTRVLTTLLKEDIEFFFSKGIGIEKLVKMDAILGEIIASSPELQDIIISNTQKMPLYMATKDGGVDLQKASVDHQRTALTLLNANDPQYNISIQLLKGGDVAGYISATTTPEGYISTNLSRDVIVAKLLDIALDSGTILVISMLFLGELLILIFQMLEMQMVEVEEQHIHYSAMRPAAFLFLFGMDSCISFVPLHIEKLYEPLFGLSKDMVMGLPISAEMLLAGIATAVAGVWVDRRKWHEPFLTGLFLAGIGNIYSWIAPDALQFILSRGVTGFGYGLALISAQGFVISSADESNKAQGLAHLFAGIFAGSICGGAAGAMLADRVGYRPVFLFGATLLVLTIFYTVIFMRQTFKSRKSRLIKQHAERISIKKLWHFLTNRYIFSLMALAIIPSAIAGVGFINYFYPIYLNRLGESQSNIGRVYMIFGLCLIYIAPFISKYIDASENKKVYLIINGLLGSAAFLIFYVWGGLFATLLAILLLGLSVSFDASRAYALKLKVTQELGDGKAMGIFFSAEKIGQVIGPFIFGTIVIAQNITRMVAYFGIAYLLITLVFILFSKTNRKIEISNLNAE